LIGLETVIGRALAAGGFQRFDMVVADREKLTVHQGFDRSV
jgi:hypothetical protein